MDGEGKREEEHREGEGLEGRRDHEEGGDKLRACNFPGPFWVACTQPP